MQRKHTRKMAFPVAVWQPRKTWRRIAPYKDEHPDPMICEAGFSPSDRCRLAATPFPFRY
jgi:hypothetical protein